MASFDFPMEKTKRPEKNTLQKKFSLRLSCLSSICNQIYDTDHLKSIYDALESVLDKKQLYTSNRKRVAPNKNGEVQKRYTIQQGKNLKMEVRYFINHPLTNLFAVKRNYTSLKWKQYMEFVTVKMTRFKAIKWIG